MRVGSDGHEPEGQQETRSRRRHRSVGNERKDRRLGAGERPIGREGQASNEGRHVARVQAGRGLDASNAEAIDAAHGEEELTSGEHRLILGSAEDHIEDAVAHVRQEDRGEIRIARADLEIVADGHERIDKDDLAGHYSADTELVRCSEAIGRVRIGADGRKKHHRGRS